MALRIKEAIKENGLNVKTVAERMGISDVRLGQCMRGNPRADTLERIARAIGCPVSDLFTAPTDGRIVCPKCGAVLSLKVDVLYCCNILD